MAAGFATFGLSYYVLVRFIRENWHFVCGVAAFATNDPEAPRILRFVLHPANEDPPPDNHFPGFCKVGADKEVVVRLGKAVTITLKDHPELFVTFAPWRNTRQSEIIPRVLELEPSSSHSSLLWAVISQPGVVPHQREFPLMLPTAAAAAPEASRASFAHHAQLLMPILLPHTWVVKDSWDAEKPRLVEVPCLLYTSPSPRD